VISFSDLKIYKLGTKTGLIALFLILLIVIGEAIFSWSHSRNELYQKFDAESDSLTSASAEAMNLPLWDLDIETLQTMTGSLAENPNIISVIVKDPSGKVLAERHNTYIDIIEPLKSHKEINAAYERHSSNLGTLSMIYSRAGIRKELKHKAMTTAFRGLLSGLLLFLIIEISGNVSTLEERVAARTTELNESVIKASAANKAKSEFLANMSHEIRTPLNGVLGMLDVLRRTPLTEKQLHYTDIINKSGQNLLTILSDILDLSKIESGKENLNYRACDLKAIIQETLNLFGASASEKNLNLNFHYAPDLSHYFITDFNRLRQILSNLIGNAIKFTSEGSVSVDVKGTAAGEYTDVEISIKDTGIGIEEDKLNLIFEKFTQAENSTTRRFGGTGLGLTISRKLAHALGGDIRVHSKPGRGTIFVVHMSLKSVRKREIIENDKTPAVSDRSERSKNTEFLTPQSENYPGVKQGMFNFLVVEDDPYNIEVMKSFLEHPKISITVAENGLEAIELYISQSFDLIFMDVSMPVMDGLKATEIIRGHEAKAKQVRTPIICLTAHVMEERRITPAPLFMIFSKGGSTRHRRAAPPKGR